MTFLKVKIIIIQTLLIILINAFIQLIKFINIHHLNFKNPLKQVIKKYFREKIMMKLIMQKLLKKKVNFIKQLQNLEIQLIFQKKMIPFSLPRVREKMPF